MLRNGLRRYVRRTTIPSASASTSASVDATPIEKLRNMIIIAHIDSGKSTLSDRLLEETGTVSAARLTACAQYLDSNPIERARQITIKARAARMAWRDHCITLIDCPGHHDFSRQVSQSARAVEGALLVVDATRGVQAQTLSSVELALESGLELLPVINKIDLPTADVPEARRQIETLVGLDAADAVLTSAKQGIGVPALLDAVTTRLPAPQGDPHSALQALVFDSYYDSFRGVVLFVRVVNGVLRRGDPIRAMGATSADRRDFVVDGLGFLQPDEVPAERLRPGDIGFVTAAIRRVGNFPVGDTLTHSNTPATTPLPGYEPSRPVVFCGLFPIDANEYNALRQALNKLQLQDASILFEADKSAALGSGFRCGFLGLLHMHVTQERLEEEFGLALISSAPSVSYEILPEDASEWRTISNPALVPDGRVKIREPFAHVEIICNQDHVGRLMELTQSRRGEMRDQRHLGLGRVKLTYSLPLSELVTDFHDAVKSKSSGFASLNYEIDSMRESNLCRLDVHVAGEAVDGLSSVIHRDKVQTEGRALVSRLRGVIPRQMFKVAIQAVVGSKVISSEHIAPFRKDVTAKCYGGDASRKKKLLKKQAEGKKKMKAIGKISIPQEAFLAVLGRTTG